MIPVKKSLRDDHLLKSTLFSALLFPVKFKHDKIAVWGK